MRAHVAVVAVVVVGIGVGGGRALAEPKPQKVDIKPFRDELLVFADATGNTYVVKPHKVSSSGGTEDAPRIWFGPAGKPLYEQNGIGRSGNGAAWSYQTWAPRITGIRPAYFARAADGSFSKSCDADSVPLTQLTGDKAKAVLDKSTLMTEYLNRRAHMLARDDSGVYYYVDRLTKQHGSKGFRVYVGKKGAMKQMALSDVASDTAGEVFSTKTGDLRLDRRSDINKMMWIRGEKRTELITLDVDANSTVIFTDLGIYQYLGTLCDNM
ncbi:MAG: hypothetical protein H0V17_21850 [Deltaproteobacteria bacterium]|nr:hypothetical protein [Deltaproteobacteria bacterium]